MYRTDRILASFDFTADKDMSEIRRWTKQQEAAIKTLSTQATNFDPQALWPERLRERESLSAEAHAELKIRLGSDHSEKRLYFAEQRLREMLPEEGRNLRLYEKVKH